MLLYLVKFYPTIGQLIDQQKIYPIIWQLESLAIYGWLAAVGQFYLPNHLAFQLPNISWANFNQKFTGQYVAQCWLKMC